MFIYEGKLYGIRKGRPDHYEVRRDQYGNIVLKRHDLYSKWAIDNLSRLNADFKGEKTEKDVEITVNFVTRNKKSLLELQSEFIAIIEKVFLKDRNQIKKISASYEESNGSVSGVKPALSTFEIKTYGS